MALAAVVQVVGAVRASLQWLGFWTAVALPLAYCYLFLQGLTASEFVWFTQLLVLHLGAFVVGRGYKADSTAGEATTGRQGIQRPEPSGTPTQD